jgi:response regulator RpfG family c-di-GMP phosphodiesterase
VVVLEPSADGPVEIAADAEVDDFLIKPVVAADLVARVRSMLRLKRLHDQLRADKLELERLNRAVAERLDHLQALLVQLVDLRVPGAAARGAHSARLAAQLADRFEIPPVLRRDLAIAAQLHEIGKVVLATEQAEGDEVEDVLEGDAWRYVVAARDLLRETDGLEPAADLIGASFENWDGTGHPDRLRQGQIPLRSRILRCLIDYHALLESGQAATPPVALDRLAGHSGTRYDPLVVAYLDAIVRAGADEPAAAPRARVPITKLEEGMVLADDLCTSSGVKLLAAGAQLTQATLETIRRRHRSDPIVHGVWIRRRTPAA